MTVSFLILGVLYTLKGTVGLAPEFIGRLSNVTISQGRDASFACSVRNLGGFKVAWIKSDTKAILAIHNHVITNNQRMDVTHNDKDTWTLTLKNVQTDDRGPYMCQVNSTPVRKQIAHLQVVIPPAIIDAESSSDQSVPEGGSIKLICTASGFPRPEVIWRRGDGQMITVKTNGKKRKSMEIVGETLHLYSVTRSEMGSYMCIARNGVPPAVSKNIQLNVNFQPQISSEQQLVGAPSGTQITITCIAEASPRPINYWTFGTGEMIVPNEKFQMEEEDESSYRFRMSLTIRNLVSPDFGSFRCVSKNSIGHAEEFIELYEMRTVPTYSVLPPVPESQVIPENDDEDYEEEEEKRGKNGMVASTPVYTNHRSQKKQEMRKQTYKIFGRNSAGNLQLSFSPVFLLGSILPFLTNLVYISL